MSVFTRDRPQPRLARGGTEGAADAQTWAGAPGPILSFDDLFATTGLFGIEFTPQADALAGQPVRMGGYMSPSMQPEAGYFVLSRAPLPNCPFCDTSASWPDDIVLVMLRVPGADIDHPTTHIQVSGVLALGETVPPEPGLIASVRLTDAVWIVAEPTS